MTAKILEIPGKLSKRGQIYQVGGPFFCSHPVRALLELSGEEGDHL